MSLFTTESNTVARLYCFASSTSFAIGMVFIRMCAVDSGSINYIRGVGTVVIVGAYMMFMKQPIHISWNNFPKVIARSLICAIPPMLTVFVVQHIKISVFAISSR